MDDFAILSLARLPISPPWLKFARSSTNSTEPIDRPPVVTRTNTELFCTRNEVAVCHRSAAFRHRRGHFGLADLRRGGLAHYICSGIGNLSRTPGSKRPSMEAFQSGVPAEW